MREIAREGARERGSEGERERGREGGSCSCLLWKLRLAAKTRF